LLRPLGAGAMRAAIYEHGDGAVDAVETQARAVTGRWRLRRTRPGLFLGSRDDASPSCPHRDATLAVSADGKAWLAASGAGCAPALRSLSE
jgi:hypothetical protein